jgi:hypothetical protein
MSMNIFSRLDPDIMHTHILPRLDGTTLTVLSSVCSELRHMICYNNEDLWRNICTTMWPSLLLDPIVHDVISTFPGGYRSFFSDAFPSLHHLNNSHCSYPPGIDLIHAVDIYIHGEHLISRVRVQSLKSTWTPFSLDLIHLMFDDLYMGRIHNETWKEYLEEKDLRLSWIVIDPTRKRAANLIPFSRKPYMVARCVYRYGRCEYEMLCEKAMAGEYQVPMKCQVRVTCFSNADGLYLKNVAVRMKDMIRRNIVGRTQCIKILLNAIQNGERKKFD